MFDPMTDCPWKGA